MPLNVREMVTGTTRRISHIRRYGALPVVRTENVAEHSYYTALYSSLIAMDIKSRYPDLDLDVGKCTLRSVFHDLEESITGDQIRTFKHSDTDLRDAIEKVSSHLTKSIDVDLGAEGRLYSLWSSAKDSSLEGRIVGLADFLTVVAYASEEFNTGNSYMSEPLTEITKWLEKSKLKFMRLSVDSGDVNVSGAYHCMVVYIEEVLSYLSELNFKGA